MGKCKVCGKSGLFLKLKNGLCESCYEEYFKYCTLIPQLQRIIDDSVKIINNTKDIETFYSRYDLIIKHLDTLIESEKYIQYKGQTPTEMKSKLLSQIDAEVGSMLCRYFQAIDNKIEGLKTEKSKVNNFLNFIQTVSPYVERFNEDNQKLIIQLCKTLQKHTNDSRKIDLTIFKNQ